MIQTTEVSITYTGDGVQTSFPYPYPYRSSEDIVGYLVNEEGYEEKITTNYTYNNVENTYMYPLAGEPLKAPMKLKLIRETPQQQNSSLPNKLPFSLLEKGMDWIIMIIQEMGTRVNAIWNIKNDVAHSSTNAKEYMDRAESAASKSEDKAVSAEQSAQNAREAETQAKQHADDSYRITPDGLKWTSNFAVVDGKLCVIYGGDE